MFAALILLVCLHEALALNYAGVRKFSLVSGAERQAYAAPLYSKTQIIARIDCAPTSIYTVYVLHFTVCYHACGFVHNCSADAVEAGGAGMHRRQRMARGCHTQTVLANQDPVLLPKLELKRKREKLKKKLKKLEPGKEKKVVKEGKKDVAVQEDLSKKVSPSPVGVIKKENLATKMPPTEKNKKKPASAAKKKNQQRMKRDVSALNPKLKSTSKARKQSKGKVGESSIARTTKDGFYTISVEVENLIEGMKVDVEFKTRRKGAYLSAMDWPLLPFYGSMSLLYLLFGLVWLVVCCCNWQDLLRVQFWIAAVIALGMLENALAYTEYASVNNSGKQNGIMYFAEIVSCIKRALARILVIIISMGFGIVKPRLGEALPKVLAAGGVYTLVSVIEAVMRIHHGNVTAAATDSNKSALYAAIPLTVIDVVLCYWVFTSLVQTTRTLSIRKNLVKLALYRRFTNTLIFMVVISIAYMIWVIKDANTTERCTSIWLSWLTDALWPFLFALILGAIMILWRPNKNSRRYDSFVPLENAEEDDRSLSDAFDSMKMRNVGQDKDEDDLKWVEENIPSVPASILPVLDSDEEVMTTKFEVSKMD